VLDFIKKKNANIFEYSQERRREALFRRENDGDGCFVSYRFHLKSLAEPRRVQRQTVIHFGSL